MAKDATPVTKDKKVTTEAKAATVSTAPKADWAIAQAPAHTYSEMAKISAGLLIGVLALMVFLLSVGLQHPKPLIRSFLYIGLVALGVNLLLYQLDGILEVKAHAKSNVAGSRRALGVIRVIHHLVFAIAIVGIVGFGLASAQLFFPAASTPTPTQTQTQG